ncbi:MAG: hypothetical protein EXX96DRAFT_606404 [Benjaminiella poitrasii]|nr:MAG: hypothetical protein EXX96DRAFT_606404 [Benjaminiella poitrasii]
MPSSLLFSKRTLSLDDFLQLQSLLNYEQQERDKHIQACRQAQQQLPHHDHPHHHFIQVGRSIDPQAEHQSRLEKQRLEQALIRLKYLKDQYRRQRAAEIQAYLEAYRRQALLCAAIQQREEEERYYRQCIAAALEQRRVQALWQDYVNANRQQQAMAREQLESQHVTQEEQEQEEQEQESYSKYHSEQLAEILKQVFGKNAEEENFYVREPSSKQHPSMSEEDDQKAMADVWKSIADQKQNSETSRFKQQQLEEKEQEDVEEEEEEASSTITSSTLDDDNSTQEQVVASETEDDLPPLQDHVVTLQDLIQQLAAEPVLVNEQYNTSNDEPKPSGIWTSNNTQESTSKPHPIDVWMNKKEQQDSPHRFQPHTIFTDAEPTPTREQPSVSTNNIIPTTTTTDDDEKDFVDAVAAEQQKSQSPTVAADPRKEKIKKQLESIARELDTEGDSDLIQRWKQVLNSELTFTKQPEGTLLLTATTDANRQFLGSEDELMRVMLKLDAIDSLGDDTIRQERRSLVKSCERLLDSLDQLKKNQWEKAVSSLSNKIKHSSKRTKQRRHRRHHQHKNN